MIAIYGDTHATYDGSLGGLPAAQVHEPLVERIKTRCARVINLGDLIQTRSGEAGWSEFNRIAGGQLNGEYYPARGNHDDLAGFLECFSEGPYTEYGDYNYHFVVLGDALFVVLDVHSKNADYTALANWLSGVLSLRAGCRFKFVCWHMPPYTTGERGSNLPARDALVPVLREHEVDICFCGHVHAYEAFAVNGVHYIVTGGAGGVPHTLNVSDVAELSPLRRTYSECYNYCEMRFNVTTELQSVTVTAYEVPSWSVIDSILIDKSTVTPKTKKDISCG